MADSKSLAENIVDALHFKGWFSDRALAMEGPKRIIEAELAKQWQPIESAPKDGTRIYVFGYWNERAAEHCQGKPFTCVAAWSTFMSDGTGYQWIYEGSLGNHKSDQIAVTFTHWLPLPPDPPQESSNG